MKARYLGTVTHFEVSEPLVALTFDDGPDPDATPRVLALLERWHASATFFVVGDAALRSTDAVRAAQKAGHVVGNHTWSHASLAALSCTGLWRELRACEAVIGESERRFFRPPWGTQTMKTRLLLSLMRYEVIGWNVDASDWSDADAERMAEKLEGAIKPGSIVLLHDAIRSAGSAEAAARLHVERGAMLAALELVMSRLSGRFRWVTIREMFAAGRPVRGMWF